MDIIPVIDIFNDKVVTAIQGKRDSYKPIDLKLYNTIDPIEIINILIKKFKPKIIYLADLGGILHSRINYSLYEHILKNNQKVNFWIDAGKSNLSRFNNLNNFIDVFCSETSKGFDLNSRKNYHKVCSFDYNHKIIGNNFLVKQKKYLPKKIIIMDLNQVGSNKYLNFKILRRYIRFQKKYEFYIAGGVKSTFDIKRAESLGAKGVLVSTLLHKSKIAKLFITKEKTNLKR